MDGKGLGAGPSYDTRIYLYNFNSKVPTPKLQAQGPGWADNMEALVGYMANKCPSWKEYSTERWQEYKKPSRHENEPS